MDLRCIGEFPLFPSWVFFEEDLDSYMTKIHAYGPGNQYASAASDNREFALAECVRLILKGKSTPAPGNRFWPPQDPQ